MAAAVYNSPHPEMFLPSSRVRWAWCACLLVTRLAGASDWRAPESQLAAKIAALTGASVISLDVRNASSIAPSDVEEIRRDLTAILGTAGVQVWQPDQAGIAVRVVLSENLEDYVWITEVHKGAPEPGIVMISMPRTAPLLPSGNAPPLTLHATKLVARPSPILDAALLDGPPRRLLVLGTEAVTIYVWDSSQWTPVQVLPIHSEHGLPRDPRGR